MTSLDPVGVSAAAKALYGGEGGSDREIVADVVSAYLAAAGSPADEPDLTRYFIGVSADRPMEVQFTEADGPGGGFYEAEKVDALIASLRAAASPADERLREALELIRAHARLDLTERDIAEAERYATIADDALAGEWPPEDVPDAETAYGLGKTAGLREVNDLRDQVQMYEEKAERDWRDFGEMQDARIAADDRVVALTRALEFYADANNYVGGEVGWWGKRIGGDPLWCMDFGVIARNALAGVSAEAPKGERITHGRHCLCSACAAEDWTNPQLAPCGMHGSSCPPVYAPLGGAGDWVSAEATPDETDAHGKADGPSVADQSLVAPPPNPDSEFIEPPVMPNMPDPESGGDKPGITPPPSDSTSTWPWPIAPDTVMPPRRQPVRWGSRADDPPTEIHDDPQRTKAYLAGLAAGRAESRDRTEALRQIVDLPVVDDSDADRMREIADAALAGVSAEATPEGCRAPHCWSEYGTPCGTCPVVAEAAPDEPTEDPLDPHDGPAPLTAEDRAAAMPPIVAPPPNPYRTLHARMSPPGAAWDEGFAAGLAARDTNEPKDGDDA